ncbi:hypothetical protein [Streptomyces sp. SD15]
MRPVLGIVLRDGVLKAEYGAGRRVQDQHPALEAGLVVVHARLPLAAQPVGDGSGRAQPLRVQLSGEVFSASCDVPGAAATSVHRVPARPDLALVTLFSVSRR